MWSSSWVGAIPYEAAKTTPVWRRNTIAATDSNPGSGNGNLTITDKTGTSGSLNATGGMNGSSIGGGQDGNGSNITITGNAEVTAIGINIGGAGIGGGNMGTGSDITSPGMPR